MEAIIHHQRDYSEIQQSQSSQSVISPHIIPYYPIHNVDSIRWIDKNILCFLFSLCGFSDCIQDHVKEVSIRIVVII